MPAIEGKEGGPGQWFALAGAAVAVAVIVALVASWPSAGDGLDVAPKAPMPTADAAASTGGGAIAKAGSPAAATAKPVIRVRGCEPIFGGGVPHQVSSAARGASPAGCGEAHSVLLDALNGGETNIGAWHCARNPNGRTLAACTSAGGRRIVARD
jgi:hypothetical protein